MKEVAYISTSQGLVFDDDILAIVQAAQVKNVSLGVTGVLCYDGARFMQILEGPDAEIDSLYALIKADPRHTDVRTLSDRAITVRSFSSWSLGYKRIAERLVESGILDGKGNLKVPTSEVGDRIAHAFAH